jgi:hypothetical protein
MKKFFLGRILFAVVFSFFATEALGNTLKPWTLAPPQGRFVVLEAFSGNAVLDRSTNLIWELRPSEGSSPGWANAVRLCADRIYSGHFGWRLPKIEELMTLMNPSGGLHEGAPFEHVSLDSNIHYWSATEVPTDDGSGSVSAFATSFGLPGVIARAKNVSTRVWCVRGGAL